MKISARTKALRAQFVEALAQEVANNAKFVKWAAQDVNEQIEDELENRLRDDPSAVRSSDLFSKQEIKEMLADAAMVAEEDGPVQDWMSDLGMDVSRRAEELILGKLQVVYEKRFYRVTKVQREYGVEIKRVKK